MSDVTSDQLGELVASVRDLTAKVGQLIEEMDKHGKVLFGPEWNAGLIVRISVLEARVAWALGIAAASGVIVLGIIVNMVLGAASP